MLRILSFIALAAASTPGVLSGPGGEPAKEIRGLYPDFARTGALVLGFTELVEHHPQTLVDVVKALNGRIPLIGVVANASQRSEVELRLDEAGVSAPGLNLVQVPVVGMWIRDYGPSFVRDENGRFLVLDAEYRRPDHEPDDAVPRYLAGYFRLPVLDVPVRLDGGNLLTNGEGWIFTTTQAVSANAARGHDQMAIGRFLSQFYGATDWMVFKPLSGEPTGHLDMFMMLLGPDVAVVGSYAPEVDPVNARQLDEAASHLARVESRSGPMQVFRIPMPSHEDGKWRSYTNVILANDTVLLPVYPDVSPELDRQAIELYSRLLPDARIVPIDASSIIQRNGSLHCISINVPELGTP